MTLHESLIAFALRNTLRFLLKPVFSPRVSISIQRNWLAVLSTIGRLPAGIMRDTIQLGGVDSTVLRLKRRATSSRGTLLYLHGGGYCVGSPRTHGALTAWLAKESGMSVVVPNYRLAPEHPFPAALNDVLAVYDQLTAQGPVFLAGDSAGGGLALSMAIGVRYSGRPAPVRMALISPWVDLRPSQQPRSIPSEAVLSTDWMQACAYHYAGVEADDVHASPLLSDLRDLPPILIQCGSDDMLCDQARSLHAALLAAGIESVLEVGPNLWHVYQIHAGQLPSADRAVSRIARFLNDGEEL